MTRKSYRSSTIRGKKRVCAMLSLNARLKAHVPRTMMLSAANLSKMFASYQSVYIKPDIGSLGIGVCKATAKDNGYTLIATNKRKQFERRFDSLDELCRHMKRNGSGKMIVQKAVSLETVSGKPYDIRVMVQRKPGGSWTVTGSFARVARKGRIVTNYAQGGQVWMLEKLHRAKGWPAAEGRAKKNRLYGLALRTARWLSGKKAGMREVGIDFARDRSGKLWILEVNSNHPQFHGLKPINPAMYDRMMSFARSYGRYSAK